MLLLGNPKTMTSSVEQARWNRQRLLLAVRRRKTALRLSSVVMPQDSGQGSSRCVIYWCSICSAVKRLHLLAQQLRASEHPFMESFGILLTVAKLFKF
jgi:hypothetical protein